MRRRSDAPEPLLSQEPALSPDLAARFAAIALVHVTREYPHKLDHVMADARDVRAPSALHPVFHGSFDWHSCVHGYWLLARLLRRFPQGPFAGEIVDLFDRRLTPERVAGECAYLAAPSARGFERPYGWAWLLKLAAELGALPQARWAQALAPLARMFVQRFRDFLPLAPYASRAGTHANTAFALRLAADYAAEPLFGETAARFYLDDRDCPAWGEPGGEDFLSPTLIEAEAMRRLLPPERFGPWFDAFLPRLAEGLPSALFAPARPTDRSDGKIAHLDGLNLSRAWAFRSLGRALAADDPRRAVMARAADAHLSAALPHLDAHYMGEHWLATFALLALDEV